MTAQNSGEKQGFDFHEAAVEATEVIAGSGIILGVGTGAVAGVCEFVDQVIANGENFPGGTVGKVAGGLLLGGFAMLGVNKYIDR